MILWAHNNSRTDVGFIQIIDICRKNNNNNNNMYIYSIYIKIFSRVLVPVCPYLVCFLSSLVYHHSFLSPVLILFAPLICLSL